jgi:hypothetical protein
MDTHPEDNANHRRRSITTYVLVGFIAIAAYLLVLEHRAHLSGILSYVPYLFLLACPIMHLFMHRGHHHRAPDSAQKNTPSDGRAP